MSFFSRITENLKWAGGKIAGGLKGISKFITPRDEEEAKRMGLAGIKLPTGKKVYIDPMFATGAIKTAGMKGVKTLGQSITSKLGKLFKRRVTPVKSQAKNLIRTRYSQIKTGLLDTEVFAKKIEKNLTQKERELIPFIIEGTAKGNKKLNKWASAISDYYDEGFEFLKKNLDDVGFVENYVNRMWDVPKNKIKNVISAFTTKNPFVKKRKIPTLKKGIEMGLKPKTTDIANLLRVYDAYKHTSVANTRFLKGMKDMVDDLGRPLIQDFKKAPAGWKSIDTPYLMGKAVSPEIAKEVKTVMEKPFSGAASRALETVNAFAKKGALSLSLFHHWALTESAISSGMGKKVVQMLSPRKIYRALKHGEYDIYKRIPLAKDSLEHGLQLGAIPDVHRTTVARALKTLERKTKSIPGVAQLTKGVRGANDIWDKTLWDYYHNGLKMFTYEKWVQESLKKTTKNPELVKRRVAQLVNDTFGGQVWEELLVTPKARQAMHWALLSPDWTISTLKQAQSIIAKGARGKQGRKFWLRAGIYMWGGSNILNYVNTKRDTGEGKWMWENDPKHKTYIYWGKDENGQKKYVRFGKQYREAMEWFMDPMKKFGSKLAPTVREAYKQLSGYSVSGWESKWAGKKFWDPEALAERAKSVAGMGIPYSFSSVGRGKSAVGFMVPISKGLTWYEAKELLMDAIENKDIERAREVWTAALENNLDAEDLYDQAKREVQFGERWEYSKVKKLINKLKKMGPEEGKKKLQEMRDSGELTSEVENQMIFLLKQEAKVKKQRERLGI